MPSTAGFRFRQDWRAAIDADPAFHLADDFAVDNPKPADPDGVVARGLSTSFIAALDPADQQAVLDDIGRLTRSLGPSFDFPYRSELQAWTHRPTDGAAT